MKSLLGSFGHSSPETILSRMVGVIQTNPALYEEYVKKMATTQHGSDPKLPDPEWWGTCLKRHWVPSTNSPDDYNSCEGQIQMLCENAKDLKAGRETKRILAIGDIHGDYGVLKILLLGLGVADIDAQGEWRVTEVGACSVVVLVGDLIDDNRSENFTNQTAHHEFKIFALIHTLRAKGLDIITILGNHEVIQMGGSGKEKTKKYLAHRSSTIRTEEALRRGKTKDPNDHATGWEMQGQGYMNRFVQLCYGTPPVVIRIGKYIFCHGGITRQTVRLIKQLEYLVSNNADLKESLGITLGTQPKTHAEWKTYGDSLLEMVNALTRVFLFVNKRDLPDDVLGILKEILLNPHHGLLMTRLYSIEFDPSDKTNTPARVFKNAVKDLYGEGEEAMVLVVGHCPTILEKNPVQMTKNILTTKNDELSKPMVASEIIRDISFVEDYGFPCLQVQSSHTLGLVNPQPTGIFFSRLTETATTPLTDGEYAVINIDCAMTAAYRGASVAHGGFLKLLILLASSPQALVIPDGNKSEFLVRRLVVKPDGWVDN